MRRGSVLVIVSAMVAILGCTAMNQQKKQPVQPDQLQFHNLRVLPPNISHDDLIATMRGFARSLGTRCAHCHVQTATEPREEFDYVSDAKPEKTAARTMIRMTNETNARWISRVKMKERQTVTCATCHRGHTVPEQWSPPTPAAAPARP